MIKKLLLSLALGGASSVFAVPVAQIEDFRVDENAGNAAVKISLSESSTDSINVTWVTDSVEGGATPGADYTEIDSLQTVTFQPGSIEQTILIPIISDGEVELDESFKVVLVEAFNATLGRQISQVTIEGDNLEALPWDPGTSDAGTLVTSGSSDGNSTTYFSITTQAAINGGWRSIMRINSGEAQLYLSQGRLPSSSSNDYESARPGNDGFVINGTEFSAGQTWYLAIEAAGTGATWEVVTGDVYVEDLGVLRYTDENSNNAYDMGEPILPSGSGEKAIGPEGVRFYRGAVPTGTPAWALYTPGRSADLFIKKGSVPFSNPAKDYDLKRGGSILLVPPYLGEGAEAYFIGVEGTEGDLVTLNSRIHEVASANFGQTISGEALGDFPYKTYRVEVPDNSFAWDIALTPTSGNPDVAVRRSDVGSENSNDGYSEAAALAADSISIAPPTLGEGVWYITVYSAEGDAAYDIFNGEAILTTRSFTDVTVNDQVSRVGWRYYVVPDIESQQGKLGWQLSLAGAPEGAELALRKNAVPSVRSYRETNATTGRVSKRTVTQTDFKSTTGLLQRARHQADVWYIGIFSPDEELGAFELTTGEIVPAPLIADGGNLLIEGHEVNEWKYFRVNIPEGFLGWDVGIKNGGSPTLKLAVSRNLLPDGTRTAGFSPSIPSNNATWPSGATWFGGNDWSGRSSLASRDRTTDRRLVSAVGAPLVPGTYFVGVQLTGSSDPHTYTLNSRMIGASGSGASITVEDLGANASVNIAGLEPTDARYFKITPDSSAAAWRLALRPTVGEAMFAVRKGFIPSFNVRTSSDVTDGGGISSRLTGNDVYHLLERDAEDGIGGGDYYVAVVSEGVDPPNASRYGEGATNSTLTSTVPVPTIDLGTLGTTEIRHTITVPIQDLALMDLLVSAETPAFDLRFENISGDANFAMLTGTHHPAPYTRGSNNGFDGGWKSIVEGANAGALTDVNGQSISITIQGKSTATVDVVITPRFPAAVAFNDGTSPISGQLSGTWRFFEIEVPEGFLGWDIRLKNVTSGKPRLVVGKARFPTELGTSPRNLPSSSTWEDGGRWSVDKDWADGRWMLGESQKTQRLIAAFGKPLSVGTYYAAVINDGEDTAPAAYTLESRAIGVVGSGASHIVKDFEFEAGSPPLALTAPAGDIAFARCAVPENKEAWATRLGSDLAGTLLTVRKGFIPDLTAKDGGAANSGGGDLMDSHQNEWWTLLPKEERGSTSGEGLIESDYYYFAAFNAEAPNVENTLAPAAAMQIESKGEIALKDLGGVSPSRSIVEPFEVESGELRHYTFTVPGGITQMRLGVSNRKKGSFVFSYIKESEAYVRPGVSGYKYGFDNGVKASKYPITNGVLISNPEAGTYSVCVRGDVAEGSSSATADLYVEVVGIPVLEFNGGSDSIFNHGAPGWVWYQVNVPEAGFIGWDIELLDDSGGDPKIVVRRDVLADTNGTRGWSGKPSANGSWPTKASWLQASDFTGRTKDDEGNGGRGGNRFTAAYGKPLEPGSYSVGIYNGKKDDPAQYSILSRGIGLPGSEAEIIVEDLVPGTPITVERDSRRTKYLRTAIPEGVASYRFRLQNTLGESMLAVRRGFIPDCDCTADGDAGLLGGVSISRDGDEWYTIFPSEGESTLVGGDYFIAVTSEGQNPPDKSTAGLGIARATVSVGSPLTPVLLGTVSTTPIIHSYNLSGGEIGAFQIEVPEGAETVEIRMEDRVRMPEITAASGLLFPAPGADSRFAYGVDGGIEPLRRGSQILSLVAPPAGPLTVTASTGGTAPIFLPASAQLQVSAVRSTRLAFGQGLDGALPNSHTGSLIDSQIRVYNVNVPATIASGQPILGWKISVTPSIGQTVVRAYPDFDSRADAPEFVGRTAIIAAPYFQTGRSWRFEVEGIGLTNYTVKSEPILLKDDVWTMPTMPGEEIGDTGEAGLDLGAGDWDFYAIDVPDGNAGVLRTVVSALNGTPHLYLREGDIPAVEHSRIGRISSRNPEAPVLYDRSLQSDETLYGNWVPLDGKTETQLNPGRYYLGIFAAENSNARYRFSATTGSIQSLEEGAALTGQQAFGSDWKYYRFDTPATLPEEVFINVTRNGGELVLHVRDTVPPGLGTIGVFAANNEDDAINDADDKKNQGPYLKDGWEEPAALVLTSPPLRPATTYYIGARAVTDVNFDIGLTFGPVVADSLPEVAFDGGIFSETIPPGETRRFFVRAPADGAFFEYTTEKERRVFVRIEQGAYPDIEKTNTHSYDRGDKNKGLKESLNGVWPWLPDTTYFVAITNETEIVQPVLFTMAEKVDDGDVLPDGWELANFGNLNEGGDDDHNGDGISNFLSYALSIDPVNGIGSAENPLPEYVIAPDAATGGVAFILSSPREDVIYTIEKSPTLDGSWSSVAIKTGSAAWDLTTVITENGITLVPDGQAVAPGSSRFYRLKVTKIAP